MTHTANTLPPLPAPLEIKWPELHSHALGCGVEDRDIRDRYEAAEYGWQDGVDRAAACVPDAIYDAEQMQAYARAALAQSAQAPAREPLLKLLDYADDSDGCQYGTLSSSLVRDLVNQALAHAAPAQPAPSVEAVTLAARDVLAERQRQVSVEGWTPEHDDEHSESEMALAAACYALSAGGYAKGQVPPMWPWSMAWWKPAYGRRDLVRAAALILAEIERLDRAEALARGAR